MTTPSSNYEAIIHALSSALESATPNLRPAVPFKRSRDAKPIETLPGPQRERTFGFRPGASLTPRTMSCATVQWHRNELVLVVGYNFEEPRQSDTLGIGPYQQAMSDEGVIFDVLAIGNPLSGVSNVKRMRWLGGSAPGRFTREYRLDLEWAETRP